MADPEKKMQYAGEMKAAIREVLEEADQHPLGHIAVELVRTKVQGRTLSLGDILSLVDDASELEMARRARKAQSKKPGTGIE